VLKAEAPPPAFDFYQMLPQSKLSVDSSTDKPKFLLRMVELKHLDEAKYLKTQLELLGFDVVLVKLNLNGDVLYRMEFGPYTERRMALADKRQLKRRHVVTRLIGLQKKHSKAKKAA
jgi:cell division protein FtsN